MKTLALEERKTAEVVFQPYDTNKMQIKINVWSQGIYREHMSLTDFIESTHSRIRVARGIPLEDFKKLIEKRFNIKNVVIMRRTPLVQDREVDIMTETNPDGSLCK